MIKAVLFDFDGTIADTSFPIYEGYRFLFKKYRPDYPIDEEFLKQFIGPALKFKIPEYFDEDLQTLIEEYREAGNKYIDKEHIKLFPGFLELVKELKKKDIKVLVITSRYSKSFEFVINQLELTEVFDDYCCIDHVVKSKPAPDQFDLMLNRYNLKKDEVIMIGDHYNDGLGALNADIEFIGVSWSVLKKEELLELGATHIINNFLEVLDIIKRD